MWREEFGHATEDVPSNSDRRIRNIRGEENKFKQKFLHITSRQNKLLQIPNRKKEARRKLTTKSLTTQLFSLPKQ